MKFPSPPLALALAAASGIRSSVSAMTNESFDSNKVGLNLNGVFHDKAFPVEVDRRLEEDINLALGKTASQSSTYPGGLTDSDPDDANKAVDGNTDGNYSNLSVTHTRDELEPWWRVDLLGPNVDPVYFAITKVKVYIRVDCCMERILPSEVQLLDASETIIEKRQISKIQDVYDLDFGGFVGQVRYVKVQRKVPDDGENRSLNLAEVEVYGQVVVPTESPTDNPTHNPTDNPTHAPTDNPTHNPTDNPTHNPTDNPTHNPTDNPTHNPTDNPTDTPTDNPTDTPTDNPTDAPTDSPTPAIKSWALELTSVNTDFDKGSEDEIILRYKIGKNRTPRVTLHKTGCEDDISGITIIPKEELTNGNGDDPSTSNYEVSLDINKSSIAGSNIWDSADNAVKLCVMVALISSETDAVVKKLERNIEVALDFENNFQTIEDANFTKISLDSNETEAAVEKYIKACTCNNKEDFICNTNSLGVDDFLNVCISSQDEEMEINYLDSLQMTQEGEGDEANVLNIVSNQDLVDGSISSKSKVAANNGVHVASVIPASFFSYESSSTATVSGVVFLKLYGSRRRLAVEMDDSSSTATHARALQGGAASDNQQSAFSMKVQLEKNEFLEITDDPNSAIYAYAAMTGVIGSAAAVVTAATFLMW